MSEDLDSLHPALQALPGTTIVGRYLVDEMLGVGGMGAVFRGHHLGLKRDVAIKVLHPDLTRDPETSRRFDREAHSASRLDHPNCLRVTDVGSTDDGVKFMVMDLLAGSELAERMGQPLAPERALLMIMQVLRGLEHAHEHGVIHRDIKPENIFVTRDHDEREVLKLVDFGIAKLVGGGTHDTRMTKAGLIFGTPAYMSPEQAMGMEADARADLYAVGVILYEMLTGSPPFESDDPVKLVRMQVSKEPPPIPNPIPAPLAEVVMKLLAKDREDRFQSATETREALESIFHVVASSDIISGVTVLGSTISGPIVLNTSGSGPIATYNPQSNRVSTATGLVNPSNPSDTFAPSALPTLPPRTNTIVPERTKLPLIGAAIIVALAATVWIASRNSRDDPTDEPSQGVGTEAADTRPRPAADRAGPDPARLAELDRFIFANKLTEAQLLLEPMLDTYPNNPILAWRQGRILDKTKKRRNRSKALASYGDAVDGDPTLLEDHDFYAELHGLLSEPKLRGEALDFALRKMGRFGHTLLLELVNDEKNPMGYNDRRRALEELATVDENDALVDWNLHLALDLLQATQSITPCSAYRDALDSIATTSDYWFLPRVENAKMPKPKTGEGLTDEELNDAQQCEGLEQRRDVVIASLQALAPEQDSDGDELIILEDESGPAEPPSGRSNAGRRRSGCNTPFGFLTKKCR